MKSKPAQSLPHAGLWLAIALMTFTGCARREALDAKGTDFLASGQDTYAAHCASCHGADARGNGPASNLLEKPAPPLTMLREKYNGHFPVDELYSMIEGNDKVGAHGTRQMPVWGNIWSEKDGTPIRREIVDRRINELIEYLRSVQTE
ncbi:MAG: cytochrome c [Rhodothermales bacterium]